MRRNEEAIEALRQAVAITAEFYGPESAPLLDIKRKYGGMLVHLGRYELGRKVLEEVVSIRSRLYGPEESDTLVARIDVANATTDARQAIRELKPLVETAQRVHGEKSTEALLPPSDPSSSHDASKASAPPP